MSDDFVTLELDAEEIDYYTGIDARWNAAVAASERFMDNRYMVTHPSEVVAQHPEGGCVKMVPIPNHPDGAVTVQYDPKEGFYCFGSKRPSLYWAEENAPPGADLFSALYGDIIPKSVVGTHLPPAWDSRPIEQNGLGLYDLSMDSLAYRETQQLEGWFKRAFTPPRSVRKFFKRATLPPRAIRKPFAATGRFLKKGLRYYGAGLATVYTGGFMPASTRNRMFGLKGREAKNADVAAKVTKIVAITAATVVTGGAAMAAMAPAAGAGAAATAAGAAASGAAATGGTVAATVGAASSGSWIATVGTSILGIAKTAGGTLAVKMLSSKIFPAGTELPAQGEAWAVDPSYDMMGGSIINERPATVAGGWDDAAWQNEPSATDLVTQPAQAQTSPMIPLAVIGIGALLLITRGR